MRSNTSSKAPLRRQKSNSVRPSEYLIDDHDASHIEDKVKPCEYRLRFGHLETLGEHPTSRQQGIENTHVRLHVESRRRGKRGRWPVLGQAEVSVPQGDASANRGSEKELCHFVTHGAAGQCLLGLGGTIDQEVGPGEIRTRPVSGKSKMESLLEGADGFATCLDATFVKTGDSELEQPQGIEQCSLPDMGVRICLDQQVGTCSPCQSLVHTA
jgi:hypothetical protein